MAATPRIAIIDDDQSLHLALVSLVRSLGYEGRGYASADEFSAAYGERDSTCIVTDYHMPGTSGLELLRRLRAAGSSTPVIMMTARTEAGLRERALAGGALCLLAKPFEEAHFIRCLQRALPGMAAP